VILGNARPRRHRDSRSGTNGVSVRIEADRLKDEMARRGWAAIDLAREARLSPATVSTALSGKPISARSLALIAAALLRAPVIGLIDSLVGLTDHGGTLTR